MDYAAMTYSDRGNDLLARFDSESAARDRLVELRETYSGRYFRLVRPSELVEAWGLVEDARS